MRMRRLSVRQAGLFEQVYVMFESMMKRLHPLLARIGYARLERPVATVERVVKKALFDCHMCGRCALGSTGMSCSMNCPKQLRNGPCGGVRSNGHCEVQPDMPCVWVDAVDGASRMRSGERIAFVQLPVDRRLEGTSSWLREAQRLHDADVQQGTA